MKIHLDADRCQGHQMCTIAAPELFGSDDYGNAVILGTGDVPPALEAKARRAANNCPEHAIALTGHSTTTGGQA